MKSFKDRMLRKISTITRKSWEANPDGYAVGRAENITTIINANPAFNCTLKIAKRPF
jgi:hypothetical protein